MQLVVIGVRSDHVFFLLPFGFVFFSTPRHCRAKPHFQEPYSLVLCWVWPVCSGFEKVYHRSDNRFEETVIPGTALEGSTGYH